MDPFIVMPRVAAADLVVEMDSQTAYARLQGNVRGLQAALAAGASILDRDCASPEALLLFREVDRRCRPAARGQHADQSVLLNDDPATAASDAVHREGPASDACVMRLSVLHVACARQSVAMAEFIVQVRLSPASAQGSPLPSSRPRLVPGEFSALLHAGVPREAQDATKTRCHRFFLTERPAVLCYSRFLLPFEASTTFCKRCGAAAACRGVAISRRTSDCEIRPMCAAGRPCTTVSRSRPTLSRISWSRAARHDKR